MTILYIFLGLLALGGMLMIIQNNRAPELGVKDGRLAEVPASPNAVSTQTDDESKRVEPLPFVGDLASSRGRVLAAIEQYGGAGIVTDEETYIRVVFTTPGMRFKDDAEFFFDVDERVIHFRSASRVGKGDLGLNRKRYEELRGFYLPDAGPG